MDDAETAANTQECPGGATNTPPLAELSEDGLYDGQRTALMRGGRGMPSFFFRSPSVAITRFMGFRDWSMDTLQAISSPTFR